MKQANSKDVISEYSNEELIEILIRRKDFKKVVIDGVVDIAIERNLIKDKNDLDVKYPSILVDNESNSIKEIKFIDKKDFKNGITVLFDIGLFSWIIASVALDQMKINTESLFNFYFLYFGLLLFCSIKYFRLIAYLISWFAAIQVLIFSLGVIYFLATLF